MKPRGSGSIAACTRERTAATRRHDEGKMSDGTGNQRRHDRDYDHLH
jgi:hypothetical protein